MWRRGRLCALVVVLAAPGGAAEDWTPTRAFRRFDRTNSRGLPQATVLGMAQDAQGILWLATLDGLGSFDGTQIRPVDPAPDAPSHGALSAVVARRRGGIFVAGRAGVYVFDGLSWRLVRSKRPVGALAESGHGRLWVADVDGAVWNVGEDDDWRRLELTEPAVALASSSEGIVFVATSSSVLRILDGRVEPVAGGSRLRGRPATLLVGRDGVCWVATLAGTLHRAGAQDTRWHDVELPRVEGAVFRSLGEDRRGRIWAGSLSGLVAFGTKDGPWVWWGPENGLPGAGVMSILGDREGTLWFGLNGLGIQQWLGESWSHRRSWSDAGSPGERLPIFGISRGAGDRSLLVAAFSQGVLRLESGRIERYGAEQGVTGSPRCAAEPEPGRLWVGVRFGILESLRGGRFRTTLELPDGFVSGFFKSPQGRWYAATSTAGAYVHDGDGWTPAAAINAALDDPHVRGMSWLHNGELWVATLRGITVFRDGRPESLTRARVPALSESVNVVLEVSSDEVWAGGFGGIAIRRGNEWRRMSEADGIPGYTIYSLAKGSDGAIWAGGSAGVGRYSGDRWTVWDSRSGLIEDECNLNGLVVLADGSVLAGTLGSLARFDPRVEALPQPPLKLAWREVPKPDAGGIVRLTPGARSLRLRWAAAWLDPRPVQYRTRVSRLAPDWSAPSYQGEMNLENLAPGSWDVEVVARVEGESEWSQPLRLSVAVPPLWYETGAFLVLSALGAAGLLAGGHRLRTNHLRGRQKELEALVHQRTEELEQALVRTREAMCQAETLRAATEALSRSLDLQEVLHLILSELRRVVDYDSASVQELEGRTLRIIGGVGFPNLAEVLGVRFDVDDERSPNGQVVRTRAPRILADTDAYPEFRSGVHGPAGIRSWLAVPLLSADRLIGLVTLDKREPGFYTQEHARLALAFAAQAAVSIEKARLFEQAQRHAAEAEEHASELARAEERNRALLETAHDAFIAMDGSGVITGWNAQAEAIFGWSRAEAVGRTVADTIIPTQHREAHARGLERFLATGEGPVLNRRLELTALHRKGDTFPVELTISAVSSASGPTFGAFIRDITERRRAEVRLKAQHAATRVLAEAATLSEGTPRILEAICDSLGWVFGALWYVDAQRERLRCVETWHRPSVPLPEFDALTRQTAFARGTGLPGRIWAVGQPAWIQDVVRDTNFPRAPVAAREGLHGAFGFPILSGGAVMGVLEFFSPEIQKPDEDLLAMMSAVGSQLGQYLSRKRTEEALRESEERYRQLVENASDIIYRTDAKGYFTYVNSVGLRVSGYLEGEVDGRHFLELVRPDHRPQAESFYQEQWLQKVPSTYYEFPMITRDGRELWIGQNVQIAMEGERVTGFQAVARDITERKRAEEAVEKERRQLREIVTHAPVAMAILDREARYVAHSDCWLRDWQLEDQSLIGRRHAEALPRLGEEFAEALERALHGQVVATTEDPFTLPDGSTVYMHWTMHPWQGPSGQVDGVVIVVQSVDLLVKARQAAEEASRAKSSFVARMSHELRTPLNAILGFVQLMGRRRERDAEDREHLAVISRSGEHLLGLINDVLSIAKIESGQMTLSPEDFDLAALLRSLGALLEPRAAARRLAFEVEIPPDLPRLVKGDEGKLRQILLNLLGNAIKFTERGHVALRAAWHDGEAVFEVEDSGPGIAPEEATRLFAAFAQAEAGRQRADGTGLGLALSRSYARLMGGEITLYTTPGRGTLFRVEIALGRSSAPDAEPRAARRAVRSLAPGRRPSVLVADDNADSRALLEALLRDVGIRVRAVADGKQALEAWRRDTPDLVFMDIDMPVMDGIAATHAIRAEERATRRSRTPIVAVSASAFEHERASVMEAGCDAFLAKPFHEGDLFDLLAERLGVSYVYDEPETVETPAPPDETALTRERLSRLPGDWRARFREALAAAETEEALRLTAEVTSIDPALARVIAARLKAYQLDELDELTP